MLNLNLPGRSQAKSKMQLINYCLNKFMPSVIMAVLLFIHFGPMKLEPYIILGLALFAQHFHYKAGYAMAYCESRNIDLD